MKWHKLKGTQLRYNWIETQSTPRSLYTLYIQGPMGTVRLENIVAIIHTADNLELLYTEVLNVLDGNYHCCFTGKSYWF